MTNHFKIQFEKLYNSTSGKIYNYVLRISNGNTYLAEEVLQITFLKLWEQQNKLSESDNLLPYLYTIAKNTFLNMCQHEAIKYVYYNYILKNNTEIDNGTEAEIDNDFLGEFVDGMVDLLPPMRKKVFLMSRSKHMTNKMIADELGITEKTVETHMTLALKYLKSQLKKHYNAMIPVILTINLFG